MAFKITMDKQTNKKTQIQSFWLEGFGVVLGSSIVSNSSEQKKFSFQAKSNQPG